VITTGGGFSNLYTAPSWQAASIANWKQISNSANNTAAFPGYNSVGRGYPDVSALAASYPVILGGNLTVLYGTSASTPVVSAMVSLVNAARKKLQKSSLGWINPSLYKLNQSFILKDITSGNNSCVALATVCCAQGFHATKGWDPLTGLGSINFTAFKEVFAGLGSSPLDNPTTQPTPAAGSPTISPAKAPSRFPHSSPTASPTAAAGWISYSAYNAENCPGASNLISVAGIATGVCLPQTSSAYPYKSMKYSCGSCKSCVLCVFLQMCSPLPL
jgi:hypothetical protein